MRLGIDRLIVGHLLLLCTLQLLVNVSVTGAQNGVAQVFEPLATLTSGNLAPLRLLDSGFFCNVEQNRAFVLANDHLGANFKYVSINNGLDSGETGNGLPDSYASGSLLLGYDSVNGHVYFARAAGQGWYDAVGKIDPATRTVVAEVVFDSYFAPTSAGYFDLLQRQLYFSVGAMVYRLNADSFELFSAPAAVDQYGYDLFFSVGERLFAVARQEQLPPTPEEGERSSEVLVFRIHPLTLQALDHAISLASFSGMRFLPPITDVAVEYEVSLVYFFIHGNVYTLDAVTRQVLRVAEILPHDSSAAHDFRVTGIAVSLWRTVLYVFGVDATGDHVALTLVRTCDPLDETRGPWEVGGSQLLQSGSDFNSVVGVCAIPYEGELILYVAYASDYESRLSGYALPNDNSLVLARGGKQWTNNILTSFSGAAVIDPQHGLLFLSVENPAAGIARISILGEMSIQLYSPLGPKDHVPEAMLFDSNRQSLYTFFASDTLQGRGFSPVFARVNPLTLAVDDRLVLPTGSVYLYPNSVGNAVWIVHAVMDPTGRYVFCTYNYEVVEGHVEVSVLIDTLEWSFTEVRRWPHYTGNFRDWQTFYFIPGTFEALVISDSFPFSHFRISRRNLLPNQQNGVLIYDEDANPLTDGSSNIVFVREIEFIDEVSGKAWMTGGAVIDLVTNTIRLQEPGDVKVSSHPRVSIIRGNLQLTYIPAGSTSNVSVGVFQELLPNHFSPANTGLLVAESLDLVFVWTGSNRNTAYLMKLAISQAAVDRFNEEVQGALIKDVISTSSGVLSNLLSTAVAAYAAILLVLMFF
jgi:hypothetical protein